MAIKRIYEEPSAGDGRRILVDRVWPRGMSKERAALADWMPEVGPSNELRKWFGHEPERWEEFERRYRAELATNEAFHGLAEIAAAEPVTLLYSARDTDRNQAIVLAAALDT